jgi:hypothetical protein
VSLGCSPSFPLLTWLFDAEPRLPGQHGVQGRRPGSLREVVGGGERPQNQLLLIGRGSWNCTENPC